MKIYVGNLSYEVTEDELAAEFGTYGRVDSVAVPSDKFSGRPKGFAFVDMPTKTEADAAIAGLNGKSLKDRTIVVNESKPRPDSRGGGSFGPNKRPGGGFGGGRNGRSGGGGGRGGRPGGGGGRDRRF
jgi:cold-inducible RNA-binding protein